MNIIARKAGEYIRQQATVFPIVAVTGPRQAGKMTLLRNLLPDYKYVSLENPDNRNFAFSDPNGFLRKYDRYSIIDEVQQVPQLFSFIQTIADQDRIMGQYILSGSQHFPLLERITQSLAGRVSLVRLLPLQFSELKDAKLFINHLSGIIFKGFYPAIFDRNIPPAQYYTNYIETYVERDLRSMINIRDLTSFRTFLKLCAGRVGQITNMVSLANDCGISSPTAKSWLSILEASFIIFLLPPYYRNFNKRLIKSPKLYFYDTGLVCNLLGMQQESQVDTYYQKGALFENLVIAEIMKQKLHEGNTTPFYYWRDNTGNEIDLIIENFQAIEAYEMKAGATINQDFFKAFKYLAGIKTLQVSSQTLVYGGDQEQQREGVNIVGWSQIDHLSHG